MKFTVLFILLPLLFYSAETFSQPCLPEGITFSTQSQVDEFKADFPDCTEIAGYVLIEGNDITNLDSLHMLTAIGGYF